MLHFIQGILTDLLHNFKPIQNILYGLSKLIFYLESSITYFKLIT
jgi:hypothetical protein